MFWRWLLLASRSIRPRRPSLDHALLAHGAMPPLAVLNDFLARGEFKAGTSGALAARGESRAALRAALFRRIFVRKPRRYPHRLRLSGLDSTKNHSLSPASDFHHGLLVWKPPEVSENEYDGLVEVLCTDQELEIAVDEKLAHVKSFEEWIRGLRRR